MAFKTFNEVPIEPEVLYALDRIGVSRGSGSIETYQSEADGIWAASLECNVRGIPFQVWGVGPGEQEAIGDAIEGLAIGVKRFKFDSPATVATRIAGVWVWAVSWALVGTVVGLLLWIARRLRRG